jgi:hypothetical protein
MYYGGWQKQGAYPLLSASYLLIHPPPETIITLQAVGTTQSPYSRFFENTIMIQLSR